MTLVSVIIPTHNRSVLLKQAIESVLAVRHDDIELEVLVVDDGSVDDTAEVVKDYPVMYLRERGGLGPAGVRNVGIDAAHGEYIAFLDDDDLWLPTHLVPQLRILREHPEYALVFAQMWFFETSPDEPSLLYRPDTERPECTMVDLLDFAPSTDSLVIRRSVAQQFRFDLSLRMGEDWDWVLRIAKSYPIGYAAVPVALVRRNRPDHKVSWDMVRYSTIVFNRHTRTLHFLTRLRLGPILWKRRAMYARLFIQQAETHARHHHYLQAARALYYAARSSPVRFAARPVRHLWRKLARPHAVPATQSAK